MSAEDTQSDVAYWIGTVCHAARQLDREICAILPDDSGEARQQLSRFSDKLRDWHGQLDANCPDTTKGSVRERDAVATLVQQRWDGSINELRQALYRNGQGALAQHVQSCIGELREVSDTAARGIRGTDADVFKPADWFTKHYDIPAERLRQAARRYDNGNDNTGIRSKGEGRQKRYSVADAQAVWPGEMEQSSR